MWRFIFVALISSVACHDVYRFNRELIKPITEQDKISVKAVNCPDNSQCDDGSTCCIMADGNYACCPYSSAVCCSDKQHCCPQNTVCNLSKGSCDSSLKKMVSKMKLKVPAIYIRSITCPDGTQCDDGSTCCTMADGRSACCPYSSAVCCSDKLHCCPQNTVCNLSNGSCDSSLKKMVSKMKLKVPAIYIRSITCPDGTQCDEGSTCCTMADGRSACCPYSSAVCCSDKLHCCPQNTVCNLSNGSCDSSLKKMVSKMKLKVPAIYIRSITCPDGTQCDEGSTCCTMADGRSACCPYSSAVCCSDKQHCCPENTVCNLSKGSCDSSLKKMVSKMKLKVLAIPNLSVVCPDGTSTCGSGFTCCILSNGSYGCCQFPNAVCCSDKQHCCPSGTVCNMGTGNCDPPTKKEIPLIKAFLANPVNRVICPNMKYQCSDGQTCCKLSVDDDAYGCCQYSGATCCSDGIHCCPNQTKCNVASGTCESKKNVIVSLLKPKVPAVKLSSVICPDGISQCEDKETCCMLSSGNYGCCKGLDSVCCADKLHCCPHNTVCNLSKGTCDHPTVVLESKIASISVKSAICPNGNLCGNSGTCCPSANNSYSCCAYPNAVCCSDHSHCCPNNTSCNLNSKSCDKNVLVKFPLKNFHP